MIPTDNEFKEFFYPYIENFIKKEINRANEIHGNKCIFIKDYYIIVKPDGTNILKEFDENSILYIYNKIIKIGNKFESNMADLFLLALFNYFKYEKLNDSNSLLDIDNSIYYTYICKQEFLSCAGVELVQVVPNMDLFYKSVKDCNKYIRLYIFIEHFIHEYPFMYLGAI